MDTVRVQVVHGLDFLASLHLWFESWWHRASHCHHRPKLAGWSRQTWQCVVNVTAISAAVIFIVFVESPLVIRNGPQLELEGLRTADQ